MIIARRMYIGALVIAALTFTGANASLGAEKGKEGSACTVTGNNGKKHSGTYSNDIDGKNCSGSWGAVACSNHDCKDATKTGTGVKRDPAGGTTVGGTTTQKPTKPVVSGGAMKPVSNQGSNGSKH